MFKSGDVNYPEGLQEENTKSSTQESVLYIFDYAIEIKSICFDVHGGSGCNVYRRYIDHTIEEL